MEKMALMALSLLFTDALLRSLCERCKAADLRENTKSGTPCSIDLLVGAIYRGVAAEADGYGDGGGANYQRSLTK